MSKTIKPSHLPVITLKPVVKIIRINRSFNTDHFAVNTLYLAPTVQITKANYAKVGKKIYIPGAKTDFSDNLSLVLITIYFILTLPRSYNSHENSKTLRENRISGN